MPSVDLPCASNSCIASASVLATTHSLLLLYQAGIRCPHHSWREIHQSFTFSIQCLYEAKNFSGISLMVPFSTYSKAGFASWSILQNHCIESLGSMAASVRSEKPTCEL